MNNLVFEVKVHYSYESEKCYGKGVISTFNVMAKNDADAREIVVESFKKKFKTEDNLKINYCEINHVATLIN